MSEVVRYDERTFGLPVYDRMRQAIVEAYRVDEVADIRDKALACDIRLRAERRAGRLLNQLEKSKGGDVQAWKWQQLADIPEDEFEAHLAGPEKPSTTGILKPRDDLKDKINRMDRKVLWAWGHLRAFERESAFDRDPRELYEAMSENMQRDVRRLVPSVIAWLERLQ